MSETEPENSVFSFEQIRLKVNVLYIRWYNTPRRGNYGFREKDINC